MRARVARERLETGSVELHASELPAARVSPGRGDVGPAPPLVDAAQKIDEPAAGGERAGAAVPRIDAVEVEEAGSLRGPEERSVAEEERERKLRRPRGE